MSKGRIFSRPRTKVYDTNYNIGESYYRPALDRLDRKYGGGDLSRSLSIPNGDSFSLRTPQPSTDLPPPSRTSLRDVDDEFFPDAPRRRPNSALLTDFDSIFDSRTSMRPNRPLDDQFEEDLSSSMKRLTAKAFAEEESNAFQRDSRMRSKMDFGEKMMDTVGLSGRARQALEDEGLTVGRRRFLKMTSTASEVGDGEELTRWTALKAGGANRGGRALLEEEDASAAAVRARKSRARLEDLESEMQAISEKSLAREKRVRDLKALVQENEASALDNLQSTIKVKSSIQSEKKTVTF